MKSLTFNILAKAVVLTGCCTTLAASISAQAQTAASAPARPASAPALKPGELPPNFSFFLTSEPIGRGADLGGLAGADAHCQKLATAVNAGSKTWRAYLSTQALDGQAAVNARDRIGNGPWVNARGAVVARGHFDRTGGGNTSWNSAHRSRGCGQTNLVATGGAGLLYCFAAN